MPLSPVKITSTARKVVFQGAFEMAQGGFSLDATGLTAGQELAAGTPIVINEATRRATVANDDADVPAGLLVTDVVIAENAEISVVLRGTVYERRIPVISAALKAKMPNIIFSQSF